MFFARLCSAALLLAGATVVANPAEAAVFTATGVRCTVIGTSGDDRLAGTSGNDVICGRGGSDTILARAGRDLVDAGPGNDTVYAGAGADRVLGGTGVDHLHGGSEGDALAGGPDGDFMSGGDGADTLTGQDGNDDLAGGGGQDSLGGGAGTNWCTVEAGDSRTGCAYDLDAPVAHTLELSRHTVDVTNLGQEVSLRMRLTDDTGITSVQYGVQDSETAATAGGGRMMLASGTVRDGWWEDSITIPRWSEPADHEIWVAINDRVHRTTSHSWGSPTLTVLDDNPDRDAPRVVALATPSSSFVADVRTAPRTVRIKARLTDTVSGIHTADFCLMRPTSGGYGNLPCERPELVDGDLRDGWWVAEVVIPEGSIGGDWNVSIWLSDRAHPGDTTYWMGPDDYRTTREAGFDDPVFQPIPLGAGRFKVIGSTDNNAPAITDLTATPDTVDTLTGSPVVMVRVRAVDVEKVTGVGAALHLSDDPGAPSFYIDDFQLVSGTRKDGIWKATLTLPQGTPPGTFYFQAWVEDVSHWRSFVSAGSPYAGESGSTPMDWNPTVTVQQTG